MKKALLYIGIWLNDGKKQKNKSVRKNDIAFYFFINYQDNTVLTEICCL